MDGDYHTCVTTPDAVDDKTARDQCQGSKRSLHDGDSPLLNHRKPEPELHQK
jgi:hypothetical protein